MKIVQSEMSINDFIDHLEKQTKDFEEHVDRMKTQYEQIRYLKQNLPNHELIIHMDFAENYSCKSVDEPQGSYWNQISVTLHPIVVYYHADNQEELAHKSFVVVSDEMSHSASTVLSFLDAIMPEIKALDSEVQMIYYWTDSPSSQYRNFRLM